MNLLIAGIGANLTFGLLSSITSTTKGIYDMIDYIKHTGSTDIKKTIEELDLEATIKIIHCTIAEIYIDHDTPSALHVCLKSLIDVIKLIYTELEKINNRIKYNNSLWVGKTFRSYRFANCEKRLRSYMKILESRKKLLIEILGIRGQMIKNQDIYNLLSESTTAPSIYSKDIKLLLR